MATYAPLHTRNVLVTGHVGTARRGEIGGNRRENVVGKWESDRIAQTPDQESETALPAVVQASSPPARDPRHPKLLEEAAPQRTHRVPRQSGLARRAPSDARVTRTRSIARWNTLPRYLARSPV